MESPLSGLDREGEARGYPLDGGGIAAHFFDASPFEPLLGGPKGRGMQVDSALLHRSRSGVHSRGARSIRALTRFVERMPPSQASVPVGQLWTSAWRRMSIPMRT